VIVGGRKAHLEPGEPPRWPRCSACKRPNPEGISCKRRDCPEYVDVWLGDQRKRLITNLSQYEGPVTMTTITAPGADRLPWDDERCAALGDHRHDPRCGCAVRPELARIWNESAPERMSGLHQAAATRVRRELGSGALHMLARAPELQARGVIHYHVVLGYGGIHRQAAELYVQALAELAPWWGFGFVDRKLKASEGYRAAGYIAKYVTKGERAASGLREMLVRRVAPARAVYVATRLTVQTRCTMRTLRGKRWLHHLLDRTPGDRETYELLGHLASMRLSPVRLTC
jgi:hypothetical protein